MSRLQLRDPSEHTVPRRPGRADAENFVESLAVDFCLDARAGEKALYEGGKENRVSPPGVKQRLCADAVPV